MKQSDQQAFEGQRASLISLAYRMLGERAAAEDIVQDAWIAWNNVDRSNIKAPSAWLYQVTNRLAIDALRSARARRESYVGPWLPEPLLEATSPTPEDSFAHARECELALLWAMERLSPEERSAFILRKAFDSDYADIAKALGKTASACRKLVSRAALKVKSENGTMETEPTSNADMLQRFSQACISQDQQQILELLAPNVVAITDGGGKVRAALRPLIGAKEVTQVLLAVASKAPTDGSYGLVKVNGQAAIRASGIDAQIMVSTVRVNSDGLIDWIYVMRNPDKIPQ
jgi:RNA polymerase sigma-70 factor (ECF subfamily)